VDLWLVHFETTGRWLAFPKSQIADRRIFFRIEFVGSTLSATGTNLVADPLLLRQHAGKVLALKLTDEEIPDVILLDHVLADGERGTDFLPRFRSELAHVPLVLITGTLDIRHQLKALQGPFAVNYVIDKPVDIDELRKTINEALNECGMAETVRSIRSLERAEMIHTSEPERQFAERLGRQHELLKRLRGSGDVTNVSQLARELKVSRRTIARDLHELVDRGQLDPRALPVPSDTGTGPASS
jgi:response regulator of citrate/malate metabolism